MVEPMQEMSFRTNKYQAGLSLVELMIATALGLLIVAALTQLFSDVSRTNREMAKASSQIENARFAVQYLRNDIVHAGYWGPYVPEFDDLMYDAIPADTPTIIPDPCLDFASWSTTAGHLNSLIGIPVQAHEAAPGSCGSVINDKLADTDILIVRHAETCVAGGTNCDADLAGRLYFQVSNCEAEIDAGSTYSLDPNSYLLTEKNCTSGAAKRKYVQNIYYVRNYALTSGDGIPTLVRSEYDLSGGVLAQQPAQALVQGIERFRVELGIDSLSETGAAINYAQAVNWLDPTDWTVATNRGDGIPDGAFVHCTTGSPCTVEQLRNVSAVKLYILARADEITPGYIDSKEYSLGGLDVSAFNDSFKRHVFSTTVRLNNVSGRRETP